VRYLLLPPRLDVLAIEETWLWNLVDSGFVGIENYVLVRLDRSTATVGGGVTLYVKESLQFPDRLGRIAGGYSYRHYCCVSSLCSRSGGGHLRMCPPGTPFSDLHYTESCLSCGMYN